MQFDSYAYYSVSCSPRKRALPLPRAIPRCNTRSTPLRIIQHPTGHGHGQLQGGRRHDHQQTAAAPCANRGSRGPAGPAVAAAAGYQGSQILAIGAARTAIYACARGVFGTAAAPPTSLEGHQPQPRGQPGATPQQHARWAPGGGHVARRGLDDSPSPQPLYQAPARTPDLFIS